MNDEMRNQFNLLLESRVRKMSCCIMTDLIEFGKKLEYHMCKKPGVLAALAPSLTVAGSVAENTRLLIGNELDLNLKFKYCELLLDIL